MKYKLTLGFFLLSFSLFSQIAVTYPWPRSVFQRSLSGFATIPLSGEFRPETSLNQQFQSSQVSVIEARLVPLDSLGIPNGPALPWQILVENPSASFWTSTLASVPGGWYQLEVRWRVGTEVRQVISPRKVGVGEVFVVAGQSNAQGEPDNGPVGTADDRVNTFHVNAFYDNNGNCPDDIITPVAYFSPLDSATDMALFGYTAWAWGKLGERLARRLQVPVLFINAATGGSTVRNWRLSADGLPTQSIYTGQQYCGDGKVGYPYKILKNSLSYFSSMLGTRAILWHQGEADNDRFWGQNTPPMEEMRDDLLHVIQKTREETDFPIPWVVSRVSYVFGSTRAEVIQAQNEVIQNPNLTPIFPGPETDFIVPREDDLHFDNLLNYKGLDTLAKFWDATLTSSFFTTAQPLLARENPTLTYTCTEVADQFVLNAPSGSYGYRWVRDNNPPYGSFIASQSATQVGLAGETYRCYVEEVPGYWRVSSSITLPQVLISDSIQLHLERVGPATAQVWASGCVGKIQWVQTDFNGIESRGVWGVTQDSIRFSADQLTSWYALCQDVGNCQTRSSEALTWDPDNCAFSHNQSTYSEKSYKAQVGISSNTRLNQGSKFSAGSSVMLNPGFEVPLSTVFQAEIGGCLPSTIQGTWPPCALAGQINLSGLRLGAVAEFRFTDSDTWKAWDPDYPFGGAATIQVRASDRKDHVVVVSSPGCP